MTTAQFHALLDCHRIATGADQAPDTSAPTDDDPGLYATRDGLTRLAQMPYGG